jgi:hypothetical protein
MKGRSKEKRKNGKNGMKEGTKKREEEKKGTKEGRREKEGEAG